MKETKARLKHLRRLEEAEGNEYRQKNIKILEEKLVKLKKK